MIEISEHEATLNKSYPIVTLFNILTFLPLYISFVLTKAVKLFFNIVIKAKVLIKAVMIIIGYFVIPDILTVVPAPFEFIRATPNRALVSQMLELSLDVPPSTFIMEYLSTIILYICTYLAIPMLIGEYIYSVAQNIGGREIENEKLEKYSYLIDWDKIEGYFSEIFAKIKTSSVAAYEADKNKFIINSVMRVILMLLGIIIIIGICYIFIQGKNGLYNYFYGPVSI
ncbi:MAG: hypothetical protein J6P79_11170 [Pseudobutyrivibrio sp.]|nr:hypothetical protein [Pseudobutyrivibrio sp.]